LQAEIVALYEQHAAGLLRYAASLTNGSDQAGDAVQEAFLRYFVERSYGHTIEFPRAWLYRVLRHYLLDRMTSAAVTHEVGDEHLAGITDPACDPESLVHRGETSRRIEKCLSGRERECLGLRSEGFSYLEIAKKMGLKTGTVGALLARANQKLQTAAEEGSGVAHIAEAVHHLFLARSMVPAED